MTSGYIITCNAGSSNTKFALFKADTLEKTEQQTFHNRQEGLDWLGAVKTDKTIAAIGHRVVHGGREFIRPVKITDEILIKLHEYIPLAPLHQPAALELIGETQKLFPDSMHVACFDTAFHRTMPEIEQRFALPEQYFDEGIIRYGFHGVSYEYIADVLPDYVGDVADGRVIIAHLGGGCSACAMLERKSVSTSMGFSTLEGLMMSTRCGSIDAGVLLYMLEQKKLSTSQISELLYKESGLKGVSAISGDMRMLLESKEPTARLAIELFCRMAAREISALIPAIGGLDVLVFTGGIGEHSEYIRTAISDALKWIGNFKTVAIKTDEELVIAKACL